jgi:hypothetical protein
VRLRTSPDGVLIEDRDGWVSLRAALGDRWIKPGQAVQLEIDGIATLTNRVAADATPATAVPAGA